MEAENIQLQIPTLTVHSLVSGVNEYLTDQTKTYIWSSIFALLQTSITIDIRLSVDSQKLINFYLGKVSEADHPIRGLIAQNK